MSTETVPPALDGARLAELVKLAKAVIHAESVVRSAIGPEYPPAMRDMAGAREDLADACTPDVILALCAALEAGAALAEGVRHAKRENAILGVHSFRLPELVERFETGATVTETTND